MKQYIFLLGIVFLSSAVLSQDNIDPDGYNIFYYENGEVASEGLMRNGQPDGFWKTYYENGVIKSEGNRKDFLLDSIWTFYNDTGHVALQITYEAGKKNGIRRTFHEDEIIEENFVDDIKQGFTYVYYPDNTLWKEVNFVDGLEEGTGREYAKDDGRVVKLIYYKKGFISDIENINRIDKNGMKQGKWKYFYDNWQVKMEGVYKNDLKHGYFKEYSQEGTLLSTAKYIDGILQEDVAELAKLDIKREYYPDGKLKIVASYKEDVPEGVRREYSPEGEVVSGYIFKNGSVIGEGIINEEGIKDGPWKEFYTNGTLKSGRCLRPGKRIGEWKFYHQMENLNNADFIIKKTEKKMVPGPGILHREICFAKKPILMV
ncbi:MAG: toxin-antitoxin system YwqK family antitoxin [Bacteroidales bacterium]